MANGITRSAFVRGALAAWAARQAVSVASSPISAQPLSRNLLPAEPALFDLDFTVVARSRPFDLLPAKFAQVHLTFGSGASGPGPSLDGPFQADGEPASVVPGPEGLHLHSSRTGPTFLRTQAGPVAPYASVVADFAPTGGLLGNIALGLVRDAQNSIAAVFDPGGDPSRGTVAVDIVSDGGTRRYAAVTADLTGPSRFAFALNENYVTALTARGDAWVPVTQHRITGSPDLRSPPVLREYRYGFGAGGVDASVALRELRAGYFGQAGLRDLHVVSYADGRPYIRDRKLYLTATQAGLSFFQAAHWGVWTLDIDDPERLDPVAQLFFARDGLVLGDHAGQIVYDERDGAFRFAVSSWGDFAFRGVHIRFGRTADDILSGVHVLESAPMPLPTDLSTWDPAMARIGERWHVGFVESPYQDRERGFKFHPALARGEPGAPVDRLSRVGADPSRTQTEGAVLQKVGGRWYLLASDGADRQYRAYDLAMNRVGTLNAPYGSNIPHPQVVPIYDEERTTYWLLTFDGTQFYENLLGYGTHGDVIVMRAAATRSGPEFP